MAKKKQTYEQALERLEKIVELIEDENTSLEEAVKLYKEGAKLSAFCSEGLIKIEQEISVLKKNSDGNFELENFNISKKPEEFEEVDYE